MDIHFETTGCRLNQIESEAVAHFFLDASFSVSLEPFSAKTPIHTETILCVINTCAVTQKAEQKDRRIIRLLLEKCPNAVVIVTGCYAQLAKNEIEKISNRIVALPGLAKSRLKEVPKILRNSDKIVALRNKLLIGTENLNAAEDAFSLSTTVFFKHSRSSLKIQDGCNNACSYCTIHIARGKSVSLDAKTVISRVQELEKAGHGEVVLTAVNIGQYESNFDGEKIDFSHLLLLCLKKTEKIAFRISSIYPESVDDFFCEVVKNPRVRPYFHISVQSGSDKILKKMARHYKASDVEKACEKLRQSKENPFISCDIIAGFSSENEDDFLKTVDVCQKCNFAWIHAFPFSERPGTPAFDMTEKVPERVRKERVEKLTEIAKNNKKRYILSCVGKVFDAIIEKSNAKNKASENQLNALTENFLHCRLVLDGFDKSLVKQGDAVKVEILSRIKDFSDEIVDCVAELV